MKTVLTALTVLLFFSAVGYTAGIVFDDFDGGGYGFTSSWSGTQFGLVTNIDPDFGNSFQALGSSTAEYTSSSNIPILDVSGDATYYLCCLYYATGEDQYSVLKLRNGTPPAGVPSILFRNSGWADAYIGEGPTANEINFLANKLYFAVLKIDCNPTGTNDAVYLNLYNLTDGEVVPAAEPTVWQTDGKPGNTTANFVETSADNIQVIGRGSIDSTFDNVLLTTNWDDVYTASVPPPPLPEIDYYVATDGDDENPGTLTEPFATIQKAASLIQPGYTVYIRAGVYREDDAITVVSQGTAGNPITFEAYNDEEVVISGCDLITGWTQQGTSDIWYASCDWDAGTNGKGNTVFVGGDFKIEARQFAENDPMDINDWGYIAKGDLTYDYFESDDIKGYGDDYWNGGTVRFHVCDWALNERVIADYDSSSGRITFDESITFISQKHGFGFYIKHHPDMTKILDKPGEWFKEIGVNTMYYHAEPSQNPNTLEIENKRRGYGFALAGRDYITIKGVMFRGCSISTNSDTDYNIYQGCKFYGHDFDYDGRLSINGDYNIFRDNEVSQAQAFGVGLNGTFNQAVNNYIHDIYGEGSAAFSMAGSDHFVCRNTARRIGRYFVGSFPPRCEISYNFMEECGILSWDTGYFDADAGAGTGGNCIIHHNVMRSPDTWGFYSAFYSGANITFHHNIMYDWDPSYYLVQGSRKNFVKYIHNTFIGLQPNYSVHQDRLAKVTEANYNNNLQITLDEIATIGVNCRGNWNYSESDFVDFANDDFHLAAGSGAIDAGIVLLGINDGYSGSAPDAGALEHGQAMWDVGHDFVNPPNPAPSWEALLGTNLFDNGQFKYSPSGWTYYAGSPNWFFGNSWNVKTDGLARLGLYSMQLNPGDGMSRVFTDLKPDTWYTVGSETRLTDQLIDCDQYNNSQGTITTGDHRDEDYITGLADGDWVSYTNVDFGNSKYNELELIYSRDPVVPYDDSPESIEVHLDSVEGQLLGIFYPHPVQRESWLGAQTSIPSVSGVHTVYLVARGTPVDTLRIADIRFQNTNIANNDRVTIGVHNTGGIDASASIGYARWINEYEKFTFKTGPASISAELYIENNGIYDAYLDQLAVYERDPISYDEKNLVESDGIVNSEADYRQVEFVQAIDIGHIELFNVSDSQYLELSNFKVSVWDRTPSEGGQVIWQKTYFPTGSVAQGSSFKISGNEISDDGHTRLGSVMARLIVVENNGVNAAGNTELSLADVSIYSLANAPASNNVAMSGQASQLRDYSATLSFHASKGINGVLMPFGDLFIGHPNDGINAWWQVDLQQTPTIDQIVIINRSTTRRSFRVSVWDDDPDSGGIQLWGRDYYVGSEMPASATLTINGSETSDTNSGRLDAVVGGRFVRLQMNNSTDGIVFTEVQVWEKELEPKSPNMNGDEIVNLEDFTLFAACWMEPTCEEADFNNSDDVGLEDLEIMAEQWLDTFTVVMDIIAFDDFDGGQAGFTSTWSGTQFGLVTDIASGLGNSFQALGSSTAEYTSSSNIPDLDVSGDATYYLSCLYYATGEDQYSVLKLRNGTSPAGVPSILFRNSGWADAYTGSGPTNDEIDFEVNKLYLAVLKIDCNPTGTDDEVWLNLYNLTDGDVVPVAEPAVWQTDGFAGNTTANFIETSANNIQVVGRGSIDSTFDNVLLITEWADVVTSVPDAYK